MDQNLDLSGAQEAEHPHKTWFIERGDGMIFPAREVEAWNLLKNRTNWMRQDFKVIGVSDGTTFFKTIKEQKAQTPQIKAKIAELQKEYASYDKTEHRLKYEDIVDDDDERLVKIQIRKKDITEKLTKQHKELEALTKHAYKKAIDAELAVARGNIEMPMNQDVIAPDGQNKNKLLQALGK